MDHIILTRFSVTFLPDQPPHADDWLLYRFGFFADATVSSLASQSVRAFRWLVFLDDRVPAWLRGEMTRLSAGLFEPVYVSGPFGTGVVRRAIGNASATPLLTTRLDSDDALGVRFVETVQREAREALEQGLGPDGLYLNATRGLQIDRAGRIYRYDYPANPFVSFVESRIDSVPPRTVLQDQRHGAVREHGPVRAIRAEPLWLQVVHGSNLANDIRGVRVHPRAVQRSFELDLPYRTDLGLPSLLAGRVLSLAAILRLWIRNPRLAQQSLLGRIEFLRGTRTRPRRTLR